MQLRRYEIALLIFASWRIKTLTIIAKCKCSKFFFCRRSTYSRYYPCEYLCWYDVSSTQHEEITAETYSFPPPTSKDIGNKPVKPYHSYFSTILKAAAINSNHQIATGCGNSRLCLPFVPQNQPSVSKQLRRKQGCFHWRLARYCSFPIQTALHWIH